MKLISNSKHREPFESGTAFRVKECELGICIHMIHGCGDTWYLNCRKLNINNFPLKSEGLFECIIESKGVIKSKIEELNHQFYDFYNDDSEIELLKY